MQAGLLRHLLGPWTPLPCPGQGRHLLGASSSAPQCDLCSAATWVWGLGPGQGHDLNVPTLGLWGPPALTGAAPQDRPPGFILDPRGSGGGMLGADSRTFSPSIGVVHTQWIFTMGLVRQP